MKPFSERFDAPPEATERRCRHTGHAAAVAATALLIAGCAGPRALMPTPNVYAEGVEPPYAEALPAALRTTRVDVLYATDRKTEPREDGRLDYGSGRSLALAVGNAQVDIGGDSSWEALADDARSGVRSQPLYLDVASVNEFRRTPEFPLPYDIVDGRPVIEADTQREVAEVAATVHTALEARLARSPRKEVLLYVHGVANTFDEALVTTAELWHYMGREFVTVAYTWPAGKGGALRGYTYDRESSEFTVFHFKRFLDWLSRLPKVEGIHIISHSRGTDVVSTGIRELIIEALARGEQPRERYKLRNVVMAAPDINLEVVLMRTATEYFPLGMDRLTFYTSPHDGAIGIAEFLFSGLRLGQLDFGTRPEELKSRARQAKDNTATIEYVGERGGSFGHDYFRTNPAVSSDLVLTVRYGREPGAASGRPLKHEGGMFWQIDDNYLLEGAKR